jgi:hypothetical protein
MYTPSELPKEEMEEQKYCYLVEHPHHGTRIFYYGRVYGAEAARDAVDYAENLVPVFKLRLYDSAVESKNLSAQFNAITRTSIELPNIPVEALLSSVG